MSRAIDANVAAQNGIGANSQATYMIRWTDNAFDKEGIRIEVRFGNAGPFTTLSPLALGPDYAMVILPHFPKDTLLQFLVSVYKFNGGRIEYSYNSPFSYTVTEGTAVFALPENLTGELVGDGVIKLKWADKSTDEVYHQILFRKQGDASFAPLLVPTTAGSGYFGRGFVFLNTTEASLRLGLKPGQAYDFVVRSARMAPADGVSFGDPPQHVTNTSNIVTLTVPPLAKPTNLTGSVIDETNVRLSWNDNSTNETGYQVEYLLPGESTFAVYGTIGANFSSATVPTPPKTTVTWRVRAIYKKGDMTTAIESEPTDNLQLTTAFPPPSELVAVTSPTVRSVELTWKDNSSAESGFEIQTRPVGIGADWAVAMTVPPGTTSAKINSRLNSTATATVPLEIDSTHEFKVRAFNGSDASRVYSGDSNVSTADAKPGFTTRFYHPATVGVAYSDSTEYVLQTGGGTRASANGVDLWDIANLSQVGLSFDKSTGEITGTPSKPGVFTFPMSATFENGWTANATLTLRILRPRAAVTSTVIPDTTIATNSTFQIPLARHFADAESERAVRLETTKGNIDILLYPSLAPEAVANFMAYVKAGDYDGVVFHRSVTDFVIQGGGFKPVATPKSFTTVQARPSPKNEPGISNVTGTIAAAKLGNNPNSATHDFFLNLANNNSSDPQSLDNQNGGFTVFGRVATTVENRNQPLATVYPVLSAIASLPRGNYIYHFNQSNPNAPYELARDKRVLVNNSPFEFQDFPMDVSGAAPLDMDVLKNVFINRAYEIPVLSHTVEAVTPADVVSATIADGFLQLRGLKPGQAQVTVKGTDLEGTWSQQFFVVTVTPNYKAPGITKHPVSVAVAPNGKATFTVTATGTALTYQWRKEDGNGDFQPIQGATKSTFTINSAQAADLGNYDVLVGNATVTLTSNPANLAFKAAPVITEDPEPLVAQVGQPIELSVTATGAPAPTIAWLRGTTVVTGQKNALLKIAAAKLTDGGLYTARATNSAGKVTSAAANVYVVDKSTVTTTVKPGGKAVLKAGVSGAVTSWQWRKNGLPIADVGGISGTSTATLTVANAALTDSGDFTCEVTLADAALGPLVTGVQRLAVVIRPTIDNYTAAAGVVGFDYDFTVPYSTDVTNTPTKFVVSNLPPGLKVDQATGRITGRPQKAGRFLLGTVLNNVAGNSDVAIGTLDIFPLSQYGVGSFLGAVQPSTLNANKGGRVDLTILDTGSYTGKLVLGSDSYSLAGVITYFPGQLSPQSQIIVQRKGKSPVALYFVVDEASGNIIGQVTDGLAVSTIKGFRQVWHANWNPSGFFAGNYNVAINLKGAAVGNAAAPQGSGYGTITATTGGTQLSTIKLPDGTSVTSSSIVGPRGQFLIYQMLYKNTGSLLGISIPGLEIPSFGITNLGTTQKIIRVSGDFRWIKDQQIAAAERSYRAGFGPLEMELIGRTYIPAPANTRVLDLAAAGANGNALLDFTGGGLAQALMNPDVTLTVPTNNAVQVTAANPAGVKISVNNGNGFYSGSFELVDPNPAGGGALKRKVSFQGVLIPNIPLTPKDEDRGINADIPGSLPQAPGYFLLGQLPTAGPPPTTAATAPVMSGKVEILPRQVTVVSVDRTPSGSIVATGQTVTFTATAQGTGPFTYQWYKGSNPINGATSSTYVINSADPVAHNGTYKVLVSNDVPNSAKMSGEVSLSIADGVSNVVASRTPSWTTVNPGGSVTFQVTANGSNLTYQWRKGGQPIVGATASSYTINPVQETDTGNYDVLVSNTATPAGVASSVVALKVDNGVTNVVATRTPAGAVIATGETVTFSVTAGGSGPYTYQWYKGSDLLQDEVNSTLSFAATPASAGSYHVVVYNSLTPEGVDSNPVELLVADPVSNIQITPSGSTSVSPEAAVTFSVTAQGTGPLFYQWRKGGIDIPEATAAEYHIDSADEGDNGAYDCVVSNAVSSQTSASTTLTVTP
jgi:cyclophilin family peptidyl-prolyl cis-trans isomerase